MPISATQNAASGGKRANVSGNPQWLLYDATAACVCPSVDRIVRSISFVVVFPTLPVTAISCPVKRCLRITTQPMQPGQRVVHQQQMPRIRHIAVHHRTGRALRHRVGDEGMAIPGLAAQRDEQIIRLQAARIDRDATGGERCFHRSTGGLQQIVRGPQRAHDA